ncbi:hypothetical protein BCR43DRAFT_493662 [Syncephalastrum racemosum]|uniref:Uncharacterized protein n=1 Tax=Syncephalastrum racemosum TaxID=13706 RepID=A0A1X2HAX6_SYNRA|nr:hypothetical protein BCR43DRAFT_493662 [Syncephalastrum racemosum]
MKEVLIKGGLDVDDLQKIRCEKAPPSVHMILLLIILGMVLDTMAERRLDLLLALTKKASFGFKFFGSCF